MLPDNIEFGSVAKLVASQAAATPDAAALTSAPRSLSYKESDVPANGLADVLRTLSANRDPARFPSPGWLDITREGSLLFWRAVSHIEGRVTLREHASD
jgi:hypothetical protein